MSELNNQQEHPISPLTKVAKGTRFYELQFAGGERARLYIVAEGIFRLVLDPSQEFAPLDPALTIPISDFSLRPFEESQLLVTDETFTIKSAQYSLRLQKNPALFSIFDDNLHRYRLKQERSLQIGPSSTSEILFQNKNEFYYGGGMQNGRFSHKGHTIEIKNTNLTGRDGVAVPESFFWSNAGFAELRNTWQDGLYNFNFEDGQAVAISHQSPIFDSFYLIGDTPAALISQYYRLTGKPLFLPKYALELGHIGNFIETAWSDAKAQDLSSIKFEDGNNYMQTTDKDKIVAHSSLNGEDKYQFSARAMVERYQKNDIDLKWIIPNFKSNTPLGIESVDSFTEFAEKNGIKVGYYNALPTNAPANLVLTKKAHASSSNGQLLKNIATISKELVKKNANNRPWVMSSNGWSAIQTLATTAIDGVGGEWDEIATQVDSFIGMSLSGQPNVGGAIDGAYSGGNAQVSVRDLEWKIFTPLLFNMDNFGSVQKTPFAFNSKITRINKAYLNLRKQLLPYLYTLTRTAQAGNPVIRPLFISFPHERINYTDQIKHEFMLGDSLLIAPITNGREDSDGNSIKDNLYLPDHRTVWIDLFTGEKLLGGRFYDKFYYPLWHLPVFVRGGAIIQTGLRSANIFPQGQSSKVLYDDDGATNQYEKGHFATTKVESSLDGANLEVTVHPTEGNYEGLSLHQTTRLNIMADRYPGRVILKINDEPMELREYRDEKSFEQAESGYFFKQDFMPCKKFGQFTGQLQPAVQIKLDSKDISQTEYKIKIENFSYASQVERHAIIDSAMSSPRSAAILTERLTSRSITLTWTNPPAFAQKNVTADIEVNGLVHTNIDGDTFTFHELQPNTRYRFRIRNKFGTKVSDWSEYFGTKTKPDQMNYAIKNIAVESTLKSNPEWPLSNLVDLRLGSEWLTQEKITDEKHLELTFSFDHAYKLSRMVYIPRSRDHKGHILRAQVAISKDGENYSDYSKEYNWPNDAKNKVIGMRDVIAKSIKLRVLLSTDGLASAKEILFFVAKD
ncbi:alpha-glucosidase (family GH31 glycosyl hydrolase) [Lactobacillus colini]|uniref:Alpha-glucosidase (Family GH31 glycosyl hydrolase) n=1 Tax=Lactobacillus colini TaxID=1819254 RepID=A0ABS4MCN9_9LACO|nr:DUF5110 domain-containing protein [Lactobacillus colini]MBP2057455.1 alpha-glucosidase (family GH31 glycosyl hydrolase) [Lactobacillus colini]